MELNIKKFLKGSLISLAVLGMIGGSMNNNVVNARHRRYRTKRYTKRWHGYRYRTVKRKRYRDHKIRRAKRVSRYHTKVHNKKYYRRYARGGYAKKYKSRVYRHKFNRKASSHHKGLTKTDLKELIKFVADEGNSLQHDLDQRGQGIDNNQNNNTNSKNTDANNNSNYTTYVNMNKRGVRCANIKAAKQETLKDINRDRESLGESDLPENTQLDKVAQLRAHQIMNNFTHYDKANHEYYSDEDEHNLGYGNIVLSENIADDMNASTSKQSETGSEAADDDNAILFNVEKGNTPSQDGGHRSAIESKYNTKVGVGVTYKQSNATYYIAEDFGCNNNPTNVTHDSDSTTQHYGNGGYTTQYNDGGSVHYSGIKSV